MKEIVLRGFHLLIRNKFIRQTIRGTAIIYMAYLVLATVFPLMVLILIKIFHIDSVPFIEGLRTIFTGECWGAEPYLIHRIAFSLSMFISFLITVFEFIDNEIAEFNK